MWWTGSVKIFVPNSGNESFKQGGRVRFEQGTGSGEGVCGSREVQEQRAGGKVDGAAGPYLSHCEPSLAGVREGKVRKLEATVAELLLVTGYHCPFLARHTIAQLGTPFLSLP